MINISFCINSMNRFYHLKQTLPRNLKIASYFKNYIEFCLVNWNSQDGMDKWIKKQYNQLINTNKLKYLYTKEPQYYHMAKAKNLTHSLATKQFVCNLDADNYLTHKFIIIINKIFSKNKNIILQGGSNAACGRIILSRENFIKLNGYDEDIGEFHGNEDGDLVNRFVSLLNFPFYTLKEIPNLCPFIRHSPVETALNYRPNSDGSKRTTGQMKKESRAKILKKYKETNITWISNGRIWEF